MKQYPHHLSGGMRQRVVIAMALLLNPSLLIADEPTTALDVTIQAQILDLMLEMKERRAGASILLITHNLAVVAETSNRVAVMYGGKIQEVAPVRDPFHEPLHPYTQGLLGSMPRIDGPRATRLTLIAGTVPDIHHLPIGCKFCHAVPAPLRSVRGHRAAAHRDGARPPSSGATCILARDTGCAMTTDSRLARSGQRSDPRGPRPHRPFPGVPGRAAAPDGRRQARSTASRSRSLAAKRSAWWGSRAAARPPCNRAIVNILRAMSYRVEVSGRILYHHAGGVVDLAALTRSQMRPYRADIQMVFQDPYSSLNPRKTVGQIVGEPLENSHAIVVARTIGSRRVAAGEGRPGRRSCEPLPARVLRRTAAAHRHRAGAGDQPEDRHRRRAGQRARRLDPGAGYQPDAGPAAGVRALLRLHRPRPLGRAPHLGSHRGDVFGEPRRGGARRGCAQPAEASAYSKARFLPRAPRADPDACRRRHDRIAGRRAVAGQQAVGLCVPDMRCPIARPECADAVPPLLPRDGRDVACPVLRLARTRQRVTWLSRTVHR